MSTNRPLDASKIPDLPAEIIGSIIKFLPHRDLKNARLVSKEINHYAQRALFHTINVKVNMDSFLRLEKISLSPRLQGHVNRIYYDGRLLPWDNDFASQYEDVIGCGMEFNAGVSHEHQRERFLQSFSTFQVEYHREQYLRYVRGQKYLHRDNGAAEQDLLESSFARLPNLSEIELHSGLHYESNEFFTVSDDKDEHEKEMYKLSEVTRQTLIQPSIWDSDHFAVNRLRAIMSAAHSAEREIKSLVAESFNPLDTYAKLDRYEIFEHLLDLDLKLEPGESNPGMVFEGVANLFKAATKLQRVSLDFGDLDVGDPNRLPHNTSSIFPEEIHFPELSQLKLRGSAIGQDSFQPFLEKHATTLRSLGLEEIYMSGSFAEFCNFLSSSLNLQHVQFRGSIGNEFLNSYESHWVGELCDFEQWHCVDGIELYKSCCKDGEDNSECCALHRVERYVLKLGPSPFQLCEKQVNGNGDGEKEWCAERPDATFQPSMLDISIRMKDHEGADSESSEEVSDQSSEESTDHDASTH